MGCLITNRVQRLDGPGPAACPCRRGAALACAAPRGSGFLQGAEAKKKEFQDKLAKPEEPQAAAGATGGTAAPHGPPPGAGGARAGPAVMELDPTDEELQAKLRKAGVAAADDPEQHKRFLVDIASHTKRQKVG